MPTAGRTPTITWGRCTIVAASGIWPGNHLETSRAIWQEMAIIKPASGHQNLSVLYTDTENMSGRWSINDK